MPRDKLCLILYWNHGWTPDTIFYVLGLNRTSRPVRKSGKFSNVRTPDFRFFSFPDSGPLVVFWVGHFEFFESAILIFFCFISVKKAARSYEVSFISALWMVFPESWKRSCPNFYAHDCIVYSNGQIYGGDLAKLCGLLRIYELYK